MPGFNDTHPELLEGERFFCNVFLNQTQSREDFHKEFGILDDRKFYNKLTYKSKRLGLVAYTTKGEVVAGTKPVFISIEEYEEKKANRKKGGA